MNKRSVSLSLDVFYRESQRELDEKNHEVLDLDGALKERQGELQQRAQLVPHININKISITFMSPLLKHCVSLELGQLDVAIKEHKLEMEKNVEYLQEALEKSQKELREKDQQVSR